MALKIQGGVASELEVPENLRVPVNAVDLVLAFGSFRFEPRLAKERERARQMELAIIDEAKRRLRRACEETVPIRCRGQRNLDADASMQRHVRMIDLGGASSRVTGGDFGSKKVVRQYVVEIDEDAIVDFGSGIDQIAISPAAKDMLERLRAEVEAKGPRPVSMALFELAMHTRLVEDYYAAQGEKAYLPRTEKEAVAMGKVDLVPVDPNAPKEPEPGVTFMNFWVRQREADSIVASLMFFDITLETYRLPDERLARARELAEIGSKAAACNDRLNRFWGRFLACS